MNIFVKNLPPSAVETDLDEAFREYGTVRSSAIIRDKHTGASRGFGYVEMPDEAEAASAIGQLNGQEVEGQVLLVRQSKANAASVAKAYRRASLAR